MCGRIKNSAESQACSSHLIVRFRTLHSDWAFLLHILAQHKCRVTAIHGDLDQHSRAVALKEFSAGRQQVLVATDVAARGLDIKSIKNVVNLDAAKDIDTHVHRVGRTGRAGDKEGVAYTLLTPKQTHFAGPSQRLLSLALRTFILMVFRSSDGFVGKMSAACTVQQ